MISFKWLIKRFPFLWEDYWNNKWKRGTVMYRTETGKEKVDVRKLLEPTCPEIDLQGQRLWDTTHDKTALKCLKWVRANVAYLSDKTKYGVPEMWQEAPETFALGTGDCEDGAILLMKLMEHAGIPAWRRKIACGWVKSGEGKGGHAYVIYLADDFNWYVLDWCYWAWTSIQNFKKKPQYKCKDYYDIWWTFNEQYCWTNQYSTYFEI